MMQYFIVQVPQIYKSDTSLMMEKKGESLPFGILCREDSVVLDTWICFLFFKVIQTAFSEFKSNASEL